MNDSGFAGIRTVDCQYLMPGFAAAYLVKEGDEAAFVDNNTAHSVPLLLKALSEEGLSPEQVRYVIITHVHLDHAGGTSTLMELCPNAELLAHPRAVPHMTDPSKLVSSARKVYGEEAFEKMYGKIGPVPPARVRSMEDGAVLRWGRRELTFIHTRGHANHHHCILDSASGAVFTGDAFGLAYPRMQKKGLFIFPSTSPTDFEPTEARKSVSRIVDLGAKAALLTHFGEVTALREAAAQLDDHLDFSGRLLDSAVVANRPDAELTGFCAERLKHRFYEILEEKGLASDSELWDLLKLDLELNAQGIAYVAAKRRAKGASPQS